MAETASPRWGLPKYSVGGDDWFARLGWNAIVDLVEAGGAIFATGVLSARPAAGKVGRFYWATDAQRLYWDTGSAWVEVSPIGSSTLPTALGTAGTAGTSRIASREDHAHPPPPYTTLTLNANWVQYGGGLPSFVEEGRRCYLSGAARYSPGGGSAPIPDTLTVLSGAAQLPAPAAFSTRMPHLLAALGQNNTGSSTTNPIGMCHIRVVDDGLLRIYRIGTTPGDVVFLDGLNYRVA